MNNDLSFLWFKGSKQIAWAQNPYPTATIDYGGQIQLKPRDPQPYIQTTKSRTNLTLPEEYDVYLENWCGDKKYQINNHVFLNQYVVNGINQIQIIIAYLPYDFGGELFCIKIENTRELSPNYYSNPFLLTNTGIERTVRLDYLNLDIPFEDLIKKHFRYNSIRIQMYKNNYVSATEVENYYQTTTQLDIITNVNINRHIQWCWEWVDPWHFVRLEEALYKSPTYINQVRNYPIEMPFEERNGDTNVSENFIVTSYDVEDTIGIAEIIIDGGTLVDVLASTDILASTDLPTSVIETYI